MPFLYAIANDSESFARYLGLNIPFVQYRVKSDLNGGELRKLLENLPPSHTKIIINDSIELAHELGAWGVHLGQEDLLRYSVPELRSRNVNLGISCHNTEEIAKALEYSPDYIAIGPVFETTTKLLTYPPLGLDGLQKIKRDLRIPVIAIGGINRANYIDVLSTGVDGIAVISELTKVLDDEIKSWVNEAEDFVTKF